MDTFSNSFTRPGQACPRLTTLLTWLAAIFIVSAPTSRAAAPWGTPIMQPGIAALTCAVPTNMAPANAYSFALFDLRSPSPTDYGAAGLTAPLWNPTDYHHPSWTMTEIGSVYGITLDNDGNIYVAAHGLYSKFGTVIPYYHRYGNIGGGATSLAAAGTIYRIDRNTGIPTVFAVVPNQQTMNLGANWFSGPGIGNICYDTTHDQFFATSLEDGKVYRINNAGAVVQAFDPLSPDSGAPGLPSSSELLWGIEVLDNALHYAVWNTGATTDPGKIRRIDILGTGALDPGSDIEILTVPVSGTVTADRFVPVADITFSADGTRMVLGERSQLGETNAYNHYSRVHIAERTPTNWTVIRTLETGNGFAVGEAYGGVAYGQENGVDEQLIWMSTADAATSYGPHGLQGTRPADFPPATAPAISTYSYRVPYDSTATTMGPDSKGSGGDIEIMRQSGDCMEIKAGPIECPPVSMPFDFPLHLANLSGQTVYSLAFTPCPVGSLPANAVTTQPSPAGPITLATPLVNGAALTLPIQLPFSFSGQTVCFVVTLFDKQGNVICEQKTCVQLPGCACSQVLNKEVVCEPLPDGTYKYTITLTVQNQTHLTANPYAFAYVTFLPPGGFSPTFTTPSPNPILPGATGTITTSYYGSPGPICFNVGLHNADLTECCSPEEICIVLPDCGNGGKPDKCKVTRRAPCCPPDDTASINYSLCNNSGFTRTYNWTASPNPTAGCTQTLTSSDFTPSSGTVTLPPGGCVTIPIQVKCRNFERGDCAGFVVCASYNPLAKSICCKGTVYRPKRSKPVFKAVAVTNITELEIGVTGSIPIRFEVSNPEDVTMDVEVVLVDEIGILEFTDTSGAPPTPLYQTALTLAPGETRILTVEATRIDDGSNAPDFTEVQIFGSDGGLFGGLGLPSTTLPIRLLPPADESDFLITDIRVSESRVALTFPTERGRRYEIEHARTVLGPWRTTACTTPDTVVNPDGSLVGTGGKITCFIPYDAREAMVFFRGVKR